MTLLFIRTFFVLLSGIVGYEIGTILNPADTTWGTYGALIGIAAALILILFERIMKKVSVTGLSASVFGLLFGLIVAKLLSDAFILVPVNEQFHSLFQLVFTLVFCYLGMVLAFRGKDEFNLIIPYIKFSRQHQRDEIILLDTSVIIDGRIADICQTKFLEGLFVIPRFVLKELQQIADSQDPLKRNRGRRGLDVLNRIQKSANLDVKIHEEDFPDIHDVDAKLVKLAQILNAKIFTNDYNLNKVAEIQGVPILNINELANALKPVVMPGELMEVKILKEGKEYNQGVGYLDDGTMIVVDSARNLIGQSVRVIVTSVLQTAAGRMIFAKLEGAAGKR